MAKKPVPKTEPIEPVEFVPSPALVEKVEAATPADDATKLDASPADIPHGMSGYEWALLGGQDGRNLKPDSGDVEKTEKK